MVDIFRKIHTITVIRIRESEKRLNYANTMCAYRRILIE